MQFLTANIHTANIHTERVIGQEDAAAVEAVSPAGVTVVMT